MSRMFLTAMRDIRRSPYQAFAVSLVLSLTFFSVSVFALILGGSYLILRHFEKSPQVIAFFERGKDVSLEDQTKIKNKLESTGKLSSFRYISAKEAEAIYREKNKDDPLLLELVDYKILPPSMEISATEINALPSLKDILEKETLVKDVVFYEDVINSLSKWVSNLRIVGLSVVGFLMILSTLVLAIVISIRVKSKALEIEILRLVGANSWFIQGPFLIEGMIYGSIGVVIGWLGSYILLLYSTPFLVNWLSDLNLLPVDPLVIISLLGAELVLGIIVGAFSSWLAVKRFLKI